MSTDDVKLYSSVDEGRNFTCAEELVTFSCEVFRSFQLEWRSPQISPPIIYTAHDMPPDPIRRSLFEANLTSVNSSDGSENASITSTLKMTEPMEEVFVQCLSAQNNETESFTTTGIVIHTG